MLLNAWAETSCFHLPARTLISSTGSNMIIPKSMIILVAMLAAGFLLSMLGTIREKSRQPKYIKVGDVRSNPGPNSNGGALSGTALQESVVSSYQDSAAVHYALPPQRSQDVTYCVIDGRLVDDQIRK